MDVKPIGTWPICSSLPTQLIGRSTETFRMIGWKQNDRSHRWKWITQQRCFDLSAALLNPVGFIASQSKFYIQNWCVRCPEFGWLKNCLPYCNGWWGWWRWWDGMIDWNWWATQKRREKGGGEQTKNHSTFYLVFLCFCCSYTNKYWVVSNQVHPFLVRICIDSWIRPFFVLILCLLALVLCLPFSCSLSLSPHLLAAEFWGQNRRVPLFRISRQIQFCHSNQLKQQLNSTQLNSTQLIQINSTPLYSAQLTLLYSTAALTFKQNKLINKKNSNCIHTIRINLFSFLLFRTSFQPTRPYWHYQYNFLLLPSSSWVVLLALLTPIHSSTTVILNLLPIVFLLF